MHAKATATVAEARAWMAPHTPNPERSAIFFFASCRLTVLLSKFSAKFEEQHKLNLKLYKRTGGWHMHRCARTYSRTHTSQAQNECQLIEVKMMKKRRRRRTKWCEARPSHVVAAICVRYQYNNGNEDSFAGGAEATGHWKMSVRTLSLSPQRIYISSVPWCDYSVWFICL